MGMALWPQEGRVEGDEAWLAWCALGHLAAKESRVSRQADTPL